MATAKKKATSKEKALAGRMLKLAVPAAQKCVPLKCKITITPCAALVKCDPMTCGGLECGSLKRV